MALPINPETITCVITRVSEASDTQYGKVKVVCFEAEGLDGVRFEYGNPASDIPNMIGIHRYGAVIAAYSPEDSAPAVSINAKYNGHVYVGELSLEIASVGDVVELTEQSIGGGDGGLN